MRPLPLHGPKTRYGEQGTTIVAILGIMAFLSALLFLSFMRTETGYRLVMDRYLNGVAFDLAENGIAFEQYMIQKEKMGNPQSPNRRYVGKFAYCRGSFESFSKALPGGDFQVVSTGRLVDGQNRPKALVRIKTMLRENSEGGWELIDWAQEQPL